MRRRQSVARQQIGVVRQPFKKLRKNQVTFTEDVHPKGIDASEHDGALRFWFRDHPGKLWTVLDILSCLVFRARRCMGTVQNLLVIAPM